MTYRLIVPPAVRDDLERIGRFVGDYAGPAVALTKLDEIAAGVASLAEWPQRGTLRPELGEGIRSWPASEKGVVVFRIDEAARVVRILAITYGGQDWHRIARTRRGVA